MSSLSTSSAASSAARPDGSASDAQNNDTLFVRNVEFLDFVGSLMDGVCYDAYGSIAIEETK